MLARVGQLGAALRVCDQSDPSQIWEATERGLWSRALPCAGIRIGARCQRAVWAVTVNSRTCLPIDLALPPGPPRVAAQHFVVDDGTPHQLLPSEGTSSERALHANSSRETNGNEQFGPIQTRDSIA